MNRKGYLFCKRCFDIVAALLGLIVSSPIWIVTILGIWFSDPGPIFFRARRIGLHNEEFAMWKFRSMRVPRTEAQKSEASFKADVDRIFPFGHVIRKLKIDELPQLLNVLDGSMSVVGPRPAAKDQVHVMRAGKYAIAAEVRPGLTSPAALYDYLYGDSVEDLEDYERLVLPTRLELEAYYPTHMGVRYDLKLIWYTVICVLSMIVRKEPKWMLAELIACAPEKAENKQKELVED